MKYKLIQGCLVCLLLIFLGLQSFCMIKMVLIMQEQTEVNNGRDKNYDLVQEIKEANDSIFMMLQDQLMVNKEVQSEIKKQSNIIDSLSREVKKNNSSITSMRRASQIMFP